MGGKVSKVSQPSDAVLSGITTDSPPAPGTTTIADIPVDLLTLLFEELSIRDKIATACTCRVFHAVALNDPQLNEHKQLQRMIREREAIFKKTGFGKKLAKKERAKSPPRAYDGRALPCDDIYRRRYQTISWSGFSIYNG